ncbi:hypothetical protein IWX63_003347 [Arthrobacter sp. CAN_A2]|uniref:hypothetical protein n=1 Tax=Arthrobacter sp. CAN_A2 TaxID=2787718 RepID=UPI0018F02488
MTLSDAPSSNGRRSVDNRPVMLVLRVLIAVALIVSAVIHFQLAAGFQQAAPSGIGGGNLFRIQGAVAVLAALYVLIRGTQRAFLLAAVVALASLVAVIAYRYIQIPAIGPIPSMYEPVWYTTKTITAIAEGLALILALTAYTLHRKSHTASRESELTDGPHRGQRSR